MNTRCVSAKCFSLTHTESQEDSAAASTLQLSFEKYARRGYQPDQACLFPGDHLLKQGNLAGVRHARESAQRLQLLDMGLGQLIAAHGKLLNGDELLPLSLFHRVQSRRLA